MPFVIENNQVVSFAEFQDCVDRDQRLFESNEGIADDIVDQHLVRATEKILDRIRSSDWWRTYYQKMSNTPVTRVTDIPMVDPSKILDRQNDFTDLCVYVALADYILPGIADFGRDDNSERQKMAYYTQRASEVYADIITAGDWYDFDDDGTVQSNEKSAGFFNLKRVR
jgi:hypothetical protein